MHLSAAVLKTFFRKADHSGTKSLSHVATARPGGKWWWAASVKILMNTQDMVPNMRNCTPYLRTKETKKCFKKLCIIWLQKSEKINKCLCNPTTSGTCLSENKICHAIPKTWRKKLASTYRNTIPVAWPRMFHTKYIPDRCIPLNIFRTVVI